MMGHPEDRGRSADSDQLQPQQQQQQRGQQTSDRPGGQASYGNSGAVPADLSHGQSSAGDAGLDQAKTMTHLDRASGESTTAQRSGGQTQGGHGMGNESFEGSSLGGQSGSDQPAASALGGGQPDSSENYIDPTTGQSNDEGFARDGQGAPDPAMPSRAGDPLQTKASDRDDE